MNASILIGIVISIAGIYRSLNDLVIRRESSPTVPESVRNTSWRTAIPRSAQNAALVFAGLAVLGLSHSTLRHTDPVTSATATFLSSGVGSGVFFLGAIGVLAGAIGAVFASSVRAVVRSIAVLGLGAAMVFGVSGNRVMTGFLLLTAAVCGAWSYRQTVAWLGSKPSREDRSDHIAVDHSGLDNARRAVPEPFLTSVAVVLFCWLLGSTWQMAIAEGDRTSTDMRGSSRALPRTTFHMSVSDGRATGSGSGPQETASGHRAVHDWRFWVAAGLLAAALGPGYSRSERLMNAIPPTVTETGESDC